MDPLSILWEYRDAFIRGIGVTVQLVGFSALIGTIAGLALSYCALNGGRYIAGALNRLSFVVSAIPALVLLFWLHYPAQALLDIVVKPFWTALVTLSIINAFAIYRIVTDVQREFPSQYEASARVCGMSSFQIIRYIKAPLMLRLALPRWIEQQIVILHTSLFASLISVEETFRVAQRINSEVYKPVIIYSSMALLFLLVTALAMTVAKRMRESFTRDLSEQ